MCPGLLPSQDCAVEAALPQGKAKWGPQVGSKREAQGLGTQGRQDSALEAKGPVLGRCPAGPMVTKKMGAHSQLLAPWRSSRYEALMQPHLCCV